MDMQREKAGPEYYVHFLSYWRMSRLADWQTEEYLKAHPDMTNRPTFEDRDAVREARKRDRENGTANAEFMAALKRRFNKRLREYGTSCEAATPANPDFIHSEDTPEDVCRHCAAVNDPEILKKVFPMAVPIKFDDPTCEMIDDDPFIAEWFARLRSDEPDPIAVLDSEGNQYANCLQRCARDRVFFLTTQGRMGIGPSECQVGDRVALIAGANVPYVVRKKDFWEYSLDSRNRDGNYVVVNDDSSLMFKTFTLVGESYVHGIMDGSAVLVDDNSRPLWDILHLV
jgi:hypothetical protein